MHGIHLHAVGRCEGPDFKSAGGHWNPMGKQHGRDNPAGAHLGDLPNLVIGADGRGSARLTVDGDVADQPGNPCQGGRLQNRSKRQQRRSSGMRSAGGAEITLGRRSRHTPGIAALMPCAAMPPA
jgi:hypothetical protein